MGKIFFIMGKSSSGKDTIYRRLVEDEALKLHMIVGYTTRPMREMEKNGREYFFVTEAERQAFLAAGKVIECRSYDTVYGAWYYFTVDDGQVMLDRYDYVLIGTLESYQKVANYYGTDRQGKPVVIPFYIEVEDGERLLRAIKREKKQAVQGYQELCRRFLADCVDFSQEKLAQAGIREVYENDDLEECYAKLRGKIIASRT